MFMEAGRKFPTEEPMLVPVKPEREGGPQLEDVCKSVEMPSFAGPEILPRVNLGEEASNQSASLRHIAAIMSRMADFNITVNARRNFLEDQFYWHVASVSRWMKAGVVLQVASVVGAVVWFLVRS